MLKVVVGYSDDPNSRSVIIERNVFVEIGAVSRFHNQTFVTLLVGV